MLKVIFGALGLFVFAGCSSSPSKPLVQDINPTSSRSFASSNEGHECDQVITAATENFIHARYPSLKFQITGVPFVEWGVQGAFSAKQQVGALVGGYGAEPGTTAVVRMAGQLYGTQCSVNKVDLLSDFRDMTDRDRHGN